MKNGIDKRKGNKIIVYLENPHEGSILEGFYGFKLTPFRKDILECLSREDLFHVPIEENTSIKAS